MLFVIFDLEAVFVFAWAVAMREAGWAGYVEILIFIGILIVAPIYLCIGALEWGTRGSGRLGETRRHGERRCGGG